MYSFMESLIPKCCVLTTDLNCTELSFLCIEFSLGAYLQKPLPFFMFFLPLTSVPLVIIPTVRGNAVLHSKLSVLSVSSVETEFPTAKKIFKKKNLNLKID